MKSALYWLCVCLLFSPVLAVIVGVSILLFNDYGSVPELVQCGILVCSGMTALLVGSTKTRTRQTGFIFGLCGQPFWFYTAFTNDQWAIVLLAFWYSFCHARGIWNNQPKTVRVLLRELDRNPVRIDPRFHE